MKIIFWIRNILLLFFILSLFLVILYKYVPVRYTPSMFVKNMEQLTSGKKMYLNCRWKNLREISPHLIQAVIASEDYLFLIHNGFDSGKTNMNQGARILYVNDVTISQQTAKNVFLFPVKNNFNKLLEAYFTILIEFVWGKARIMEIYLNTVEMRDALFGAEAVAQKNFCISAGELEAPQAALIAACLVNSTELNPEKPTTYLLRRQAKIMGIMEKMREIRWDK
ncbi:MAG: transglycosylase domain-containing protein [Dysgonamonadaceae bacterium]|nr:transglycosylase domain-containing protein [Dysgonamonadaceae bacterium]